MMTAPSVDRVQEFLGRLEAVKKNGSGWQARCPAHEDRVASLSVKQGDDGNLLAFCHAGCSFDDVIRAAEMPRRTRAATPDLSVIRARPGVKAEYDYTDVNGELVFQSVRFEPKDFRQRRPDGRGGWIWKVDGVQLVPYNLPALREAASLGKTIFVVEGEKDADVLNGLGLCATTNVGGAGKWRDEYSAHFEGAARVVVVPDNDRAGEDHARRVAESVRGVVPDVRLLQPLPGVPPKGDVSDWIALGHTIAELWELVEAPARAPSKAFPTKRLLVGEPPAPIQMAIDGRLIDCDINVTAAHGGGGKSIDAIAVAISAATGRPLYSTLKVNRVGPVLMVVPEDGESGARMMVDAIAVGMKLTPDESALLTERLHIVADDTLVDITADAARIADTALSVGAVLVILDPLANLLNGKEENDNNVAGSTLDALRREVCRRARATVLLNVHLRKPGKDGPSDADVTAHDIRGGGGWVNGARLAFSLKKSGNRRTLTAIKANRVKGDTRHELELSIVADPANEAHWLSCTLTDANRGATSETLTAGLGRPLNANEMRSLGCLDDRQEPGLRISWSRWKETAGIKPDTLKSIKDRLVTGGLIEPIPSGKKTRFGSAEYAYGITRAGRMALATGWAHERASGEEVTSGDA